MPVKQLLPQICKISIPKRERLVVGIPVGHDWQRFISAKQSAAIEKFEVIALSEQIGGSLSRKEPDDEDDEAAW